MIIDESPLIEAVRSPNFIEQLGAFKEAARVINSLTAEVARAFAASSHPMALAEQVSTLRCIMPLLEELLTTDVNNEVKAFASTLLMSFGSRSGVPLILNMLRQGEGPILHIVNWLGKALVFESAESITELLDRWDLNSDPYGAYTILSALKRLNGKLPRGFSNKVQDRVREPHRTAMLNESNEFSETSC